MIRNLLRSQKSFRFINNLSINQNLFKSQQISFNFCKQNNNDDKNDMLKGLKKFKRQKDQNQSQEEIDEKQKDDITQEQKKKQEQLKMVDNLFSKLSEIKEQKQKQEQEERNTNIFQKKRNIDTSNKKENDNDTSKKENDSDTSKKENDNDTSNKKENDSDTSNKKENDTDTSKKQQRMSFVDYLNKVLNEQKQIHYMTKQQRNEQIDLQIKKIKKYRQENVQIKEDIQKDSVDQKDLDLKFKQDLNDLEESLKELKEIPEDQIKFVQRIEELKNEIDQWQKEKEEIQTKINKLLVQQQHIKKQKLDRQIKKSYKEKDNINKKMKYIEKVVKEKKKEQEEQEEKKQEETNPKQKRIQMMLALLIFLYLNNISDFLYDLVIMQSINYQQFVTEYLEKDQISKIIMNKYTLGHHHKYEATVVSRQGKHMLLPVGNGDNFLENLERIQLEDMARPPEQLINIEFAYPSKQKTNLNYFNDFLSIGLSLLILYSVLKGGAGVNSSIFGANKKLKTFGVDSKVKVKFTDVAGQAAAKKEVMEFVEFLQNPIKFQQLGAKLPRGALLTGPPGTGKTLLAKATAGEAAVPFYYLSGSDFVEMFVGVGAARVRDLFKQARKKQPCIIFIDEIDAIGKKRDNGLGRNQERENTLNQLLVEMDGFDSSTEVIILAATNQQQLLDPALLRPGRFDRQIAVDLPDLDSRNDIFQVHLLPLKLDPSLSLIQYARRLATLTPGFSGAQIANLCNEAAIYASRLNKQYVGKHDFEMATERVIAGIEKKSILSKQERHTVAIHESGHAVTSWFLEGGIPLLKLTIIPRSKGSLGFAQYLPNENQLEVKQELLDRLCIMLGGRCAEQHFFNTVTTGASDDLQKVYQLAHNIVTKFGMADGLGYIAYKDEEYTKKVSDYTQDRIDAEITLIVKQQTQRCMDLMQEYHQQIQMLSDALLEKETLDLNDIIGILGERPFEPKENYKAYISAKEIDMGLEEKDKQEKEEEENKQQQNIEETLEKI